MKIILASNSPRRKEILSSLNIDFEVIVSEIEEKSEFKEPHLLVSDLSKQKGAAVANEIKYKYDEDIVIISGDTVVSLDGEIFGKPKDSSDARRMIKALSGRTHQVFSGISLIKISGKDRKTEEYTEYEKTSVTFRKMSDEEIDLYLSMENVLDKAGAYAIQGAASLWIDTIEGNYFNVVGMPTNKLISLFEKADIPVAGIISPLGS